MISMALSSIYWIIFFIILSSAQVSSNEVEKYQNEIIDQISNSNTAGEDNVSNSISKNTSKTESSETEVMEAAASEVLPSPEMWISPSGLLGRLIGSNSYHNQAYTYPIPRQRQYRNYNRQTTPYGNSLGRENILDIINQNTEQENSYDDGMERNRYHDTSSHPSENNERLNLRNPNYNYRSNNFNNPILRNTPSSFTQLSSNRKNPFLAYIPQSNLPTLSTLMVTGNNLWNMINPMNYFSPATNRNLGRFQPRNRQQYPPNRFRNNRPSLTDNNLQDIDDINDPSLNYDFNDYDEYDYDINQRSKDKLEKNHNLNPTPPSDYNQRRKEKDTYSMDTNIDYLNYGMSDYNNNNNTSIPDKETPIFLEDKFKEDFPLRNDLYIGKDGGLYLKPQVIDGREFLTDEELEMIGGYGSKENSNTRRDLYGIDMYGMEYPKSQDQTSMKNARVRISFSDPFRTNRPNLQNYRRRQFRSGKKYTPFSNKNYNNKQKHLMYANNERNFPNKYNDKIFRSGNMNIENKFDKFKSSKLSQNSPFPDEEIFENDVDVVISLKRRKLDM